MAHRCLHVLYCLLQAPCQNRLLMQPSMPKEDLYLQVNGTPLSMSRSWTSEAGTELSIVMKSKR